MMMRTFSPKHALYFGDGTGRDTYVVTNDGGLRDLDKVGMTRRPFKNTIKTSENYFTNVISSTICLAPDKFSITQST